ncbi:hypothetical protein L2E82_52451 [Cichorium intybus]|nr:hypothetical protein L2E82_52451 [Cichorium intybus]
MTGAAAIAKSDDPATSLKLCTTVPVRLFRLSVTAATIAFDDGNDSMHADGSSITNSSKDETEPPKRDNKTTSINSNSKLHDDNQHDDDDVGSFLYLEGIDAYCGCLWLAALQATAAMAVQLGDKSSAQKYKKKFLKAKAAFEAKLWNVTYFNYDSGSNGNSKSIQADQLAGQWYTAASGLPDLFEGSNPKSSHVYTWTNQPSHLATSSS